MTNMVTSKTKAQLIVDNKELQSRLLEAKEMISAIGSGEVDAIVISGAEGEQVYSLSSAETPYRTFVEEMHGGAVTLNQEGLILYCNNRFAELVKQPVNFVIGSYFNDYIIPVDKLNLETLLKKLTSRKNRALIISLTNSTWLKLSIRLLPAYLHGDNYIIIATDITELKKKEIELLELQKQLKQQLVQLQDLRYDIINAKIETDVVNKKLKNIIKKLVKENTRFKQKETELKHKLTGLPPKSKQ
ncbi:MAG: PAS domain S-box protein [Bacteroidales bacterium]|nr:PAS domain S-box protein [Bacteroidales bacterium]